MPNLNALTGNGFVNNVFQRRYAARAAIQHIEISAAQSLATSLVVEHIPGNCVNSVRQHCGVEVEQAHCTAAISIGREQARDVGAKLVISRMSYRYSVYHHRNGR